MPDADMQSDTQTWAPIADVAAAYGVSLDTIRRRMRKGEIEGRREQTPQGFRWLALMPDSEASKARENTANAPGASESDETAKHDLDIVRHDQEELISTLQHELALRNREISRLHEVIASQAIALQHQTQALAASISAAPAPSPAEPFEESSQQGEQATVEQAPVSAAALPADTPAPSAWARFVAFLRGNSPQ
mgnify:CR=1 FL=1|jgi:hypothetical protein